MILGINTAQQTHELSLIDGPKLLIEKRWSAERNEVETLVPYLDQLLRTLGLSKTDITDIVVVSGPGSFTAVRTGVSFANALAEGLGAKLYGMTTFECLRKKAALSEELIVALHGGGLDIALELEGEVQIGPMAALLAPYDHQRYKITFEGNETEWDELRSIALEKEWHILAEHEHQTLGEMLLTSGLSGLEAVLQVEPLYLKKPIITQTSNKWKQ